MKMTLRFLFCFLLALRVSAATEPPKYDEVYNLLRAHLSNVASNNLDHASVNGLLQQLKSQAMLVDDSASNTPAAALGKSIVYDDSYAYFQLGKVEGDVAGKLTAAYGQLAQTNKAKIKGVVLDLRFASGLDYAAASAAADCFLSSSQPLLDWGAGWSHATPKTNAIAVPVTVLVNGQTSGAAEALAAVLRDASDALLIGQASAGQASVYSEFPLSNGEKLRIATAQVKSANGKTLTEPLPADIKVEVSSSDEKAWQTDAYKELHLAEAAKKEGSKTNSISNTATNRLSSRRYNEATLVRERLNGIDPNDEDELPMIKSKDEFDHPVIADPALARAMDLLKGLAVAAKSKG